MTRRSSVEETVQIGGFETARTGPEIRTANLKLGHYLLTVLGEGPFGDREILDGMRRHEVIERYLQTGGAPAQLQTVGQYRWAEAGFPVVSLGHKYAAALLVTHASEEAVAATLPPFPAFIIEIPDGLIQCRGEDGAVEDVLSVLVLKTEYLARGLDWAWGYVAHSALGTTLYRYGVRTEELLPPSLEGSHPSFDLYAGTVTDIDERAMALIGRLVVNTCLAFSDATNVRAPKEQRARHRINSAFTGRQEPGPTARVYVLARPVRHDFRERVRQYMQGETKSAPNVQVMVSGYHRMQPYGPKSALRKLIWIEPFWRGPEDAPIGVRAHTFKGQP